MGGGYRGRPSDDEGRDGVNSVGIPPVRKLLPPSPADPAVFGTTVLQVLCCRFFFLPIKKNNYSIFTEPQLLVRIGVLLVGKKKKVTTTITTKKKKKKVRRADAC